MNFDISLPQSIIHILTPLNFCRASLSSIGRVFRSLLRRRRKMAALPLPAAILDDLISGSRKWGHPRWRPEAEGPPSCAAAAIGIEKRAPGSGWRHFRRRHLGFKMVAVEMTSGGRRDVLQTSAPSMSPVEVWLYWKHLIVSLTQALSKWLSELPACYYGEVDQSACVNTMKRGVDSGKHLIYFFFFYKTYPHIKDDYASSERPMRQKGWPEDWWWFWIAYGGVWWQNQRHRFVVQYNRKERSFLEMSIFTAS